MAAGTKWKKAGRAIAAAAMAAASVATVGSGVSVAAEPGSYVVQVEWLEYRPHSLSDCSVQTKPLWCRQAESYGSLAVQSKSPSGQLSTGEVRNFGGIWGEVPMTCSTAGAPWGWYPGDSTGGPHCPQQVTAGERYSFKDAAMCASSTYANCRTTWMKNANRVNITVRPGDQIRLAVHIRDWDRSGPDDDICRTNTWVGGLDRNALEGLDRNSSLSMPANGDGGCNVTYRIRTVGAF
ncbi:hypothetical protein [Streptomyces sp. NPDC005805]|uniref:hypothetical protein n=1 Tax=Streptomyces sp. NPDC005805 TaxID=3157068 RepID=UPI0033CF1F80